MKKNTLKKLENRNLRSFYRLRNFGESQCSYEIYNCSIFENFGKINLYEVQTGK